MELLVVTMPLVGTRPSCDQRIVRTSLDLKRETSCINLVLPVAHPLRRGMS